VSVTKGFIGEPGKDKGEQIEVFYSRAGEIYPTVSGERAGEEQNSIWFIEQIQGGNREEVNQLSPADNFQRQEAQWDRS
jgi:hypothetical protein